MLTQEETEKGIKEMIRIAKKYLILIEFNSESRFSLSGRHIMANWKQLFAEHGLEAIVKRIPSGIWGPPWTYFGHIITVKL